MPILMKQIKISGDRSREVTKACSLHTPNGCKSLSFEGRFDFRKPF